MTVSDPIKPRCRAHNRQGNQCGMFSVPGARVCRMHGGLAPQVQASAAERIRALAPRAVDVLEDLLDDQDSGMLRLAAAKDVLDRAGLAAKQQVEITIREQAARLATELGLDADELIAEAERIVAGSR